jgi:hypothetical protein
MKSVVTRLAASGFCLVLAPLAGATGLTLLSHANQWRSFGDKFFSLLFVSGGLTLGVVTVMLLVGIVAAFDPNAPF